MNPSERLVQPAPGDFREPVIDPCKEREDCSGRDDVVEVADDVVGVVQVDIRGREPEGKSGQPAHPEHRQKRDREERRRREADRAAMQRHEQRGQNHRQRESRRSSWSSGRTRSSSGPCR